MENKKFFLTCPIPVNASMSVVIGDEPTEQDGGTEQKKKNIGFKFFEEYRLKDKTRVPIHLKFVAGSDRWQDNGELQPVTPLPPVVVDDFVALSDGKITATSQNELEGSIKITGVLQDLTTDAHPAYDTEITLSWKFVKKD